jgi:hypothetical protein
MSFYKERENLRVQVQRAIEAARAGRTGTVNFGPMRNRVIAEVLHEFAYSNGTTEGGPITIQAIYRADSPSHPLTLRCLARTRLNCAPRLDTPTRFALISMRHPDLDRIVDRCWFRNAEISGCPSINIGAFCHRVTRERLRQERGRGTLKLHLYQTGFPPAVVGFYAALIEELCQQANPAQAIRVTPYYYLHLANDYLAGSLWI